MQFIASMRKPSPEELQKARDAAEAAKKRVERLPQAENLVDEAAVESFPASDPPSFTPTHVGEPKQPPEDADQ